MNGATKLERKSSENSPKKKKKPSPRNPLKDLNSTCINPRISGEAPRGGCFSFFGSNSSSSLSRPRLTTPRSAPTNSRTLASSNPKLKENPKILGSKVKRNREKPGSKDSILGNGSSSKGENPDPSLSFDVNLEKNGCLNSNPHIRFEVDREKNSRLLNEMPSRSCLNSTPEKSFIGFSPELDLQTKEIERNLSNTPNSNTTPPIQASISPEMGCGSNVLPTPACFAAGHVITGVQDRRKCRPRGILTVGGSCGFSDESRVSSAVPPVADASIQWLSSPSGNVNGSSSFKADEASVNWFVPPIGDLEEESGPKVAPFRIRDSSDLAFWRFSPTNPSTLRSPELDGILGLSSPDFETTPLSGNEIRRTPSSNSSISPFSAIVRRAAPPKSGFRVSRPQEERGGYRYGTASEGTPASWDSWIEVNGTSTTSSYSKSRRNGILSPFKLDSMAEVFESVKLSPKKDACDLSFQFGCPGTPLNSVDLACFKKPSGEETSKDKNLYGSELRISWRDGLVSRIFEMGELDYCQCLSDNEENASCVEGENKCDTKNKSLVLEEENNKHIQSGSGSFEFPFGGIGVQENEAKVDPPGSNLCAESFSTDGGLISSGDSDWTLFYKNHLFEPPALHSRQPFPPACAAPFPSTATSSRSPCQSSPATPSAFPFLQSNAVASPPSPDPPPSSSPTPNFPFPALFFSNQQRHPSPSLINPTASLQTATSTPVFLPTRHPVNTSSSPDFSLLPSAFKQPPTPCLIRLDPHCQLPIFTCPEQQPKTPDHLRLLKPRNPCFLSSPSSTHPLFHPCRRRDRLVFSTSTSSIDSLNHHSTFSLSSTTLGLSSSVSTSSLASLSSRRHRHHIVQFDAPLHMWSSSLTSSASPSSSLDLYAIVVAQSLPLLSLSSPPRRHSIRRCRTISRGHKDLAVSSKRPCRKLPDPGPGPCLYDVCPPPSSQLSEPCVPTPSSVEKVEDNKVDTIEHSKSTGNVPIEWCPSICEEPKKCCWKQRGGILERGISTDNYRCFCLSCRDSC